MSSCIVDVVSWNLYINLGIHYFCKENFEIISKEELSLLPMAFTNWCWYKAIPDLENWCT